MYHYSEITNAKFIIEKYELESIYNTPYTARYKKSKKYMIELIFRANGLFTLSISTVYPDELSIENSLLNKIRQMKSEVLAINRKKLIDIIICELSKISNEFKELEGICLEFNKPVVSLFSFVNSFDKTDEIINQLIDMAKLLGNEKISVRRHHKTFRITSRSFNCFLSYENTEDKKDRKIIRRRVLQAIQLAHSLQNQYRMYTREYHLFSKEILKIFLFFNNPIMLAGINYDRSLLGSSLQVVWFNQISNSIGLIDHLSNLLKFLVKEQKLSLTDTAYMVQILRALPFNKVTSVIRPIILMTSSSFNKIENEIVSTLIDNYKIEINSLINNSNEIGLSVNQIIRKIGYPTNGTNNGKFQREIRSLVTRKFIDEIPYKGPGRGNNKKKYVLNNLMIDVREDFLKYIDEIFSLD